jgi:hypothetical protein
LPAAYGCRPAGLAWHLAAVILTRAVHPFQRQSPAWRARTAAMVAAAERALVCRVGIPSS